MTVTKEQLTARKRGKGGSLVRITVDPLTVPPIRNALNQTFGKNGEFKSTMPILDLRRDTYIVVDLFDRKNYTVADEVGISPADLGVAFSVRLDQIELA